MESFPGDTEEITEDIPGEIIHQCSCTKENYCQEKVSL